LMIVDRIAHFVHVRRYREERRDFDILRGTYLACEADIRRGTDAGEHFRLVRRRGWEMLRALTNSDAAGAAPGAPTTDAGMREMRATADFENGWPGVRGDHDTAGKNDLYDAAPP